ncbi:hypothetical protein FRB99_008892 [Tulasnella sp. 403]|nr:hypothetical protein FRB99_008892 [Tulasnella sp. 403]
MLLFRIFAVVLVSLAVSASPILEDHRPTKTVAKTNAERFAEGLPPLPPGRRYSPTRVRRQGPSSVPTTNPCTGGSVPCRRFRIRLMNDRTAAGLTNYIIVSPTLPGAPATATWAPVIALATTFVTPTTTGQPIVVWVEGQNLAWSVINTYYPSAPDFASNQRVDLTVVTPTAAEVVNKQYYQFWQQEPGFTDWSIGWNGGAFPKDNPNANQYLTILPQLMILGLTGGVPSALTPLKYVSTFLISSSTVR